MSPFTYILYGLAGAGLAVSFFKDRKKTKAALIKAWKAFENILPQLLVILVIIGLAFSVLSPETITDLLGTDSGVLGVLGAALIGSITLIPGFVAFPLAAALLKNGAGYMQIAAFVSTLMMVGIVTLPLEIKTFGKKAAIIRNISAFVFSLIAAVVIGVVL
ncbi:MAG TPA: permease [Oscillospiraceae bacterium]|nr:permease [Oscillospiraceae bacterium]HPF55597.1 permease [Clostridiales bacterium]HPK35832.1 permease [Oscillospiraceae bacterium]HPR75997.1 permease [Oscillospiraceae bacterium]